MFLEEMKALSPYFIEFGEDKSILSKEYPKDCKISGSNQRLIIIIIYNKNTFFANNEHQKM